jgi:RNA polymerase sigma factor (sigma-70 family)
MVNRYARVTREFNQLFRLGAVGGTTDSQLIEQFARQDEGADAAFEVLVERHGPMVLRVCRGVLRDAHGAEDAFQTTFLVLARKARFLWVKDSLSSWLYGVAYRVASKARVDVMRRRQHEREASARKGTIAEAEAGPIVLWSDDQAIVSDEIARLPEKYRAPTVLCYLEAMSYQAAANRLGLTEDALRGRLARARQRLRSRLTGRGVELSAMLGASRRVIPIANHVRPALLHSTVEAAMNLSVRKSVETLLSYEATVSLGERIGRTMLKTKLRTALLASLTLGVIAAGAVVLAQPTGGRRDQPERPVDRRNPAARHTGSNDGNLSVDWIPWGGKSEKIEITVDPTRHCVHLAEMSLKRDARPNDGVVRLDLERGKTYTVTAAGEAFMTDSTGPDADPYPGVVLVYGTDEEDGYAIRQTVLAPGKSITFKTPWAINPEDEVYLMAFFLDIFSQKMKRGSYKLTVTETGHNATRFLREAVDFNDPSTAAGPIREGGRLGPAAGGGMR